MNITINTEADYIVENFSLFICAIGFEERSKYQIERLMKNYTDDKQKVICFYFNDFRNEISVENNRIIKEFGLQPIEVSRKDHLIVIKEIFKKISAIKNDSDGLNIHIDFSSMPRNWYCHIFVELSKVLSAKDKFFFWYSHGDYTNDLEHCSTAGTDDFIIFSGKASTKPRQRSHLLGLGYDKIKSDAIRTVVDPTTLVVCYTYPKENPIICDAIRKGHKYLFDAASFSFSLPIDDFGFMVKRISEVVINLFDNGDVILIPDGPKPLILACSIIPNLIDKIGIVSFHVQSHSNFVPENIKPSGTISGFSIMKKDDEKV
jgi:hypothetical protein